MSYDSRADTLEHIKRVNTLLLAFCAKLLVRATHHDSSKLEEPEKGIFDVVTPRLKGLTYGSDEYKAQLSEMGVALEHHYRVNSHHPEHYQNGIQGFSLLDLVEMAFDWKAATERHADGDIRRSIEVNQKRFGYSDDIKAILLNTFPEENYP